MFSCLAFYKFFPLTTDRLKEVKTAISQLVDTTGLVIVSSEGINGTLSVPSQNSNDLRNHLSEICRAELGDKAFFFKESFAERCPFVRLKVVKREELITISSRHRDEPFLKGNGGNYRHLPPSEWEALLNSGEELNIVDTRNTYEWEIGTFKGAVTPPLKRFSELGKVIRELDLPKKRKTLIFCTGGIRCEKAIHEFERQGYKEVYQLEGGILKYIEEFPESNFTGECFVFDKRIAVDQHLRPTSRYGLCPHCGEPGDIQFKCGPCGKENAVVCKKCFGEGNLFRTCSKNCREQRRRGKG